MAPLDPEAAAQFMLDHGLKVLVPYTRATDPWPCRCLGCDSEVSPSYNSIKQGAGCRFCSAKRQGQQRRLDPDAAARLMTDAGAIPLEPYPGGNSMPWRCRCLQCDSEITPRYNNVKKGRHPCLHCSRTASGVARRLSVDDAEAFMRDHGAEPLDPYPGHVNEPWRCQCLTCGHEVRPRLATVRDRGANPCVYCSGKRVDPEDAAALMRAAGAEPLISFPGARSNWPCRCLECNREIRPSYMQVQAGGGACGYCAGARLDNESAARRMLAVGFTPLEAYPGKTLSQWKVACTSCSAKVSLSLASAEGFSKKIRCSTCYPLNESVIRRRSGSGKDDGRGSVAEEAPELVAEWHPDKNGDCKPGGIAAGSASKVWWICPLGHAYDASPHNRVCGQPKRQGCPYCSGKRVLKGFNDLATTHPAFASEWDPDGNKSLRPGEVTRGSNRSVWWRCQYGHRWSAKINNRTSKSGSGCPICSNRIIVSGVNDLASQRPTLASQWHPERNGDLYADQVGVGSHHRAWWQCPLSHEWLAMIDSRAKGDLGCPFCSGHRAWPGFNDLGTLRPDIASQWHSSKNGDRAPATVTVGSGFRAWWTCGLGHDWSCTVSNRTTMEGKCPYCANQKVLAGFNDLETLRPDIAVEWNRQRNAPLTPSEVTRGTNRKVWWSCASGHEWRAAVSSRTGPLGSNCPSCARTGFNPSLDGWLYLIRHESLEMFQIGISNRPVARLATHATRGWEVLDVRGPMDGQLTINTERAILDSLRKRGADLANRTISGTFDGYTESWSSVSFQTEIIMDLLDLVHEDEESN
jgi:hypothetical protein